MSTIKRQLAQSINVDCDICPSCQKPKKDYTIGDYQNSLAELQKASADGCLRCSLISFSVWKFTREPLCLYQNIRISCYRSNTPRISFPDSSKPDLWLELFRIRGEWDCILKLDESVSDRLLCDIGSTAPLTYNAGIANLLPGTTASHETFATVKSWIKTCVDEHQNCSLAKARQSPQRILQIFDDYLVLHEHLDHKIIYACLSHCWGTSTMLRSTTATMDAFKRCLPAKVLPPTFRDAVDICRRLGIYYIWIDSLCIESSF
jgi:Heterokaryon incompatibility protein (HET)